MEEQTLVDVPDYAGWNAFLKQTAALFHAIPQKEAIKVIGHLDADGICSSAIMIHALIQLNRKYSLTTLPTITEDALINLQNENENYFVFVDLGSGSIDLIGTLLVNKRIFILDHHMLQSEKSYEHIIQINPHIYHIDGSQEISGAGVAFLFTQELTNGKNSSMSRIAVVGAIGDVQEHDGFKKLNNDILNIAINNNLIEVKRGLKFFGVQTKPIHKILQYSSDVLIPDVSGSESGAINFLRQLGIDPQLRNGWKKIADLTAEEKKRLIAGIIMKRQSEENPGDIFSNTYLLVDEIDDSPFRDAKEFSTLLNSCGRLSKTSIGIGACLNDARMKEMAIQNLTSYRKEIVNALNWYKDNADSDKIIKGKNYLIINAEEEIMATMIGTFSSILSKSNEIEKDIFIISLARNEDNTTKISIRISGNNQTVNLKDLATTIIEKIQHGVAGGHSFAAGAVIDTEYEERFIETAIQVLKETPLHP